MDCLTSHKKHHTSPYINCTLPQINIWHFWMKNSVIGYNNSADKHFIKKACCQLVWCAARPFEYQLQWLSLHFRGIAFPLVWLWAWDVMFWNLCTVAHSNFDISLLAGLGKHISSSAGPGGAWTPNVFWCIVSIHLHLLTAWMVNNFLC